MESRDACTSGNNLVMPKTGNATAYGKVLADSDEALPGPLPLTILLADDDPVSRKFASVMLEHLGYGRPDVAGNGRDAVDAALIRSFDLVLMDLDMPELDGAQAAQELKHRLGRKAPYIVAMLGQQETGDERRRCLDAGVDEILDKPLQRQRLAEVLALAARRVSGAQDQDFNSATWQEMLAVFGRGGVGQIAAALIQDVPVQQGHHEAAVAAGDLLALKRIAHALRGSALQLGAEALAELCGEAETACAANDPAAAVRLSAGALARYTALVGRLVQEAEASGA